MNAGPDRAICVMPGLPFRADYVGCDFTTYCDTDRGIAEDAGTYRPPLDGDEVF